MSKILLSISDRWVSDARVENLARFAARISSSVVVVHVVYGGEQNGAEVSPGERVLEEVGAVFKAEQVKVETLLLFSDDIAAAIIKTAGEHGATLIMLGLASKGMLTRLIEGNVTQEVIKSTKIPVLLLPPEWSGEI